MSEPLEDRRKPLDSLLQNTVEEHNQQADELFQLCRQVEKVTIRLPVSSESWRKTGGIGMHGGYLPGYAASHGCIRLPEKMAVQFFQNAAVGTHVEIRHALEPNYVLSP